MQQHRHLTLLLLCAFMLVGTSACNAKIGDACINELECGNGQTCDVSVSRGYCTIFNCAADDCPDEAVCVDFDVTTACMLRCNNNNDCRSRGTFECRFDRGSEGFCYAPELVPDPVNYTPSDIPEEGSSFDGSGEPAGSGDGTGEGSGTLEGSGS
ncbi:MAG: hypothetical protein ACI81R_000623 [Bradymonadia bacterium]|jgi:hypothetical protein